MERERRHDLLAVAILVLLPTIWFGDIFIGTNNFYLRDLTRFHYPMKTILRDVVCGGEFPYWNRYFLGGQPLAANPQHEVFYPPNWLIFLPSYYLGFRLQILFHFYVALLGMYALLRSMELSIVPSMVGAISFGMGGLFLSLVNVLPFLYCASWIPLTFLFARRFLISRRPRDFALASLFLGVQLLVGEPTTIVQTAILLGVYALFRAGRDVKASLRNVAGVALIGITGFLFAAIQMIPLIDHFRDSIRGESFRYDLVTAWSMPPARVAELVFPNLLGHNSINGLPWYWGARLYPGVSAPFLLNIYCGLAVAALAAGGIAARMRGTIPLLILFLISVLLALGGYTPVMRIFYNAGAITTVRYPEKFILLGVFSLIVFAAHALERAMSGDRRILEAAIGFALATGIVAAGVSLLGYTRYSVEGFLAAFGLPPSPGAFLMIARAWSDWSIAGARALILLLILIGIGTPRRSMWSIALLVFVCLDLATVVDELTPRLPRRFFTETPPLAAALPENRSAFRIFHQADWETNDAPAARRFFRSGPQAYWVSRNGLFPVMSVAYGIALVMERDYDKSALLPTTEFGRAEWDLRHSGRANWWEPLMAMSNAWYRTAYNDYEDEQAHANGDMTRLVPVALVEELHQPRYYFADEIVRVSDRHEFVKKMSTGHFTPNVAFIRGAPFVPARGLVLSTRESANDASIDVEAFGRAFLVMSVTPHKYWRVTIDGQRTTPLVTNIGYQGIEVAAGRHRVEMRYRNSLVPFSATISALAALVLVVIGRRHP